ncbi:MAG: putative ABC exporter domain-containing protein [Clostridiales Family XIII bacterium]|jgi:hypothetical protein|nr:putative ABC exporter domain-containing protein [Clostridiales Family XIII bacterium]
MNSLLYIVTREMKNTLLELVRKPARLILVLLLVAFLVAMILVSMFTGSMMEEYADLFLLKGIFFAFLLLFTLIAVRSGFTAGNTFFGMEDVNLLFVSPVSAGKILVYGLARSMSRAFLMGFFILFQTNSLRLFGVGFGGVLIFFFVFMLSLVLSFLCSVAIYRRTNGSERRKVTAAAIIAAILVPAAVYAVLLLLRGDPPMQILARLVDAPSVRGIPVAGWGMEGAMALITGDWGTAVIFIGLIVFFIAVLAVFIANGRSEYYEDVLAATETAFERRRALERNVNASAALDGKKVRVAKTGVGGIGASAIFYSHIRESLRENRFGMFNRITVIYLLVAVAASFFTRENGSCVLPLQIIMWMQVIYIGQGHGVKELYMHFIYLIPEPPFRKLLWSNLETAVRSLVEGILVFGVAGAILRDPPLLIIGAVVTYVLFSLLLIAVNCLFLRWTGMNVNAGILFLLYYLAAIFIMLPGAIPAVIMGYTVAGDAGITLALGILSLWELIAALVCFALSRGILHSCDMPAGRLR